MAPVSVNGLLAAATELLIEAQDRLDGDPDLENYHPDLEDSDLDSEHDGCEPDDAL
jgi:hypothetical protein